MAEAQTPRRSTRKRKANTLYEDQVEWSEDVVRRLRAPSDSPDRSSESSAPESVQRELDIDFRDLPAAQHDDAGEDAEMSDATAEESIATPSSERSISDLTADHGKGPPKKMTGRGKDWQKETGSRNRMLHEGADKLRGTVRSSYYNNFGPELEDQYPVLQSRDIWRLKSRDIVLPSRASLTQALHCHNQGKYLILPLQGAAGRNGRPTRHFSIQLSRDIGLQEACSKHYIDNVVKNAVVIGPLDHSTQHDLDLDKPVDVFRAYEGSSSHHGWLMNLGASPLSMDWAPCLSDYQYLAVAFKSTQTQRSDHEPSTAPPAFTASPGYAAHIQILKIIPKTTPGDELARLSQNSSPQPYQQLCMKWGSVLSLKWLRTSKSDFDHSLIFLSSDGNIRIVQVDLRSSRVVEIEKPALIARSPTETIFSCFCLPDTTAILAGDTMGRVHLFDLSSSSDGELSPCMTISIHHTYIMSLSVANDSPHFLASQSATGEIILTDLRAPAQDRVVVRKTRLPTRNLSYFHFTRTFITTADLVGNSEPAGTTSSNIIGHNLRHFYQTSTLIKLPEASGICTSLATSPFHPVALVANASGSVFTSNLLRRMLPMTSTERREKSLSWMLKLYEIQWQASDTQFTTKQNGPDTSSEDTSTTRPAQEEEKRLREPNDLFHGPPTRNGITRFHQGFMPEKLDLSKNKTTFAATTQIIMPEEQAVTTMSWNPNPRFSGWAAIAWGSGILAIRDLSHDVP